MSCETSNQTVSRRQVLSMGAIIGGMSIAAPAQAQFSIGKILDAGKKVVDAAAFSDADMMSAFGQMAAEMDRQNPVAGPDDPYGSRLATLSQGLENHDGLDLDIKAYLVRDVNAFAMADGTIRIFAGLMDRFTDDEIRYVIGHEIGHVQLGHTRKRMEGALQKDAAFGIADAAGGKAGRIARSELGALFGDVVSAQHSQKHEKEADDYAFDFMKEKRYDAAATASALDKLAEMGGDTGLPWLKTHPSPAARAKRMRAKL